RKCQATNTVIGRAAPATQCHFWMRFLERGSLPSFGAEAGTDALEVAAVSFLTPAPAVSCGPAGETPSLISVFVIFTGPRNGQNLLVRRRRDQRVCRWPHQWLPDRRHRRFR